MKSAPTGRQVALRGARTRTLATRASGADHQTSVDERPSKRDRGTRACATAFDLVVGCGGPCGRLGATHEHVVDGCPVRPKREALALQDPDATGPRRRLSRSQRRDPSPAGFCRLRRTHIDDRVRSGGERQVPPHHRQWRAARRALVAKGGHVSSPDVSLALCRRTPRARRARTRSGCGCPR